MRSPQSSTDFIDETLLLFAALFASCLLLLFHLLLELFSTLGADFGTLLTLGVDDLLGSKQLDQCLLSTIALADAGEHDASVTTAAIAKARCEFEQLLDRFACHKIRTRKASRSQIALLAESDHLLDLRLHGFCLGHSRLDPLFQDQRRDQVTQQRAAMLRVSSQLPTTNSMTHD